MTSKLITLNDGKKLPALGFGNGTGGFLKSDKSIQGVKDALDVGFRHVDTAQMYETEEFTRQAIEASPVDRKDIWVTTKRGYFQSLTVLG